ncbi:PIG-L family deacetylase [Flavobacterium selenitireducens]|uniref:PIG-L family deacetylase n=1 Tax=Flavobacterium selenitireducens TaxID=2722704 RepID=UPI00168ADDE4|nr:PIG-L family deacetylase [Flavobacterium selenitireducens]MBD3581109.1 PIG-L family deacetylase [Flavobacterium selenitireducens]
MSKRLSSFALLLFFGWQSVIAQPKKPDAVEIHARIQKLNFLGSVLYIAAHPDDENTRLISWFANEQKARTAYLSLTRGDGGQNLIGPELRELLGVIRTQELIEARKIDGGEQFFSRANDFGYSKTPEETLKIWDKDEVLSDVVYMIRKFRPDVIVNRFDHRTPGSTHGHHTASAMLSLEAFDLAANPKSYPAHLKLSQTWQPKRIYMNTSWWFYGSKEKFDKADKTNLVELATGVYYESVGKSNQEIAALSRSSHKSQGFGNTGVRGEDAEYLEFLKGDRPKDKANLFEGIDTSWNRVKGGKAIGEILAKVEKEFDFRNPSVSIPDLLKAYELMQKLTDDHWKKLKSEEVKEVIAACAGLYLEAVSSDVEATPGSSVKIKAEAINRSEIPMTLNSITTYPPSMTTLQVTDLKPNNSNNFDLSLDLPETLRFTEPYWLSEKGSLGMYKVSDAQLIGNPDISRQVKVTFNIGIGTVSIPFERTVVYKYNDDVKGEVYEPFDIVPAVTTSILDKVAIFSDGKPKKISVKVTSGKNAVKGDVALELPKDWKVSPASAEFELARKGESTILTFEVSPSREASEISVKSVATVNGQKLDKERVAISYPHISKQQVIKASEAKFIRLDIRTGKEKIAYVMGAGDEVPNSLRQMGYDVVLLSPLEINGERLKDFDVVMTGIRAYNVVKELEFKQSALLDFVKSGKTMIVQYNTLDDLTSKEMSPFKLRLSRDRVTEEDAEVRFLDPKNPILNYPNKITSTDFDGWKQERGLYYPNEWDKAFTPVISANDKGETPKNGAILVAKYGNGHYIYTGLSFFRELPEGVPGAFRLIANMISIGNSEQL